MIRYLRLGRAVQVFSELKRGCTMTKKDFSAMGRRDFIAASSFWALGTSLTGANLLAQEPEPKKPVLLEELTPEELELVESSAMATDLKNFFGKGYGCSESGLLVALRYLEKPEELVWVAGGFGGGLMHGDLCGFLIAGVMACGLVAGELPVEKKEAKKQCGQMVKSFWPWWKSMAPLHCKEIREGRTDFKVCHRLGKLASVKLEELFEPARQAKRVA
jgi:hypothetical protein